MYIVDLDVQCSYFEFWLTSGIQTQNVGFVCGTYEQLHPLAFQPSLHACSLFIMGQIWQDIVLPAEQQVVSLFITDGTWCYLKFILAGLGLWDYIFYWIGRSISSSLTNVLM